MISQIYEQAELAMAAYAKLLQRQTIDQLEDLQAQGFSVTQAEEFAARYPEVVTQFNDTETGFSVTIFKDIEDNLTVAFRGTEQLTADLLFTDSLIGLHGAGYDQIVALVNWWLRVTTPAGDSVNQFRITQYFGGEFPLAPPGAIHLFGSSFLEAAPSVEATGELAGELATDADHRVNVTGHSLGAHLALALAGRGAGHPNSPPFRTHRAQFRQ